MFLYKTCPKKVLFLSRLFGDSIQVNPCLKRSDLSWVWLKLNLSICINKAVKIVHLFAFDMLKQAKTLHHYKYCSQGTWYSKMTVGSKM